MIAAAASSPSVTDWISAISSLVYTCLTSILAVFAVFAWRNARAALNASREASEAAKAAAVAQQNANEQAERDSKARTRPYVFAEIVPGLQGPGCYDLRITNTGRSAARGVTMGIDPAPERDLVSAGISDLFSKPRALPPGSSLRVIWRIKDDGLEDSYVGMTDIASVTIRYNDSETDQYADAFELRCDASALWPVPEEGEEPGTDLSPAQRRFYRLLQTMTRRIGELSR